MAARLCRRHADDGRGVDRDALILAYANPCHCSASSFRQGRFDSPTVLWIKEEPCERCPDGGRTFSSSASRGHHSSAHAFSSSSAYGLCSVGAKVWFTVRGDEIV